MRILTLLASTVLLLISQSQAQIRINEVCASNSESLYDEDSDTPDWVELYNFSDQPVNLSTWKISDKPDSKLAWQFPDTIIQPKEFIIVHASEKNRISSGNFAMHIKGYNSIVGHNNRDGFRIRYKQISGDFEAEVSIKSMSNEGYWGSAGLQVRETLSDTTNFMSMLTMSKQRDDFLTYYREKVLAIPGWRAVYGNPLLPHAKVWMKRQNDSIYVGYKDRANKIAKMEVFPNFLNETLYLGVTVSGNNEKKFAKFVVKDFIVDGNEISFSDLNVYEVNTNEKGYDFAYNEIHTNFSIKDDETIYLYHGSKQLDSVKLQPMTGDVTNIWTDANGWRITDTPTPGETNGIGYIARISKPIISYANGKAVLSDTNNAIIRYTLNNSLPNTESKTYTSNQPIGINKTTVVKAIAYKDNYLPSFASSELIMIDEPSTSLPIVSISADSVDLWGENGILDSEYSSTKNASFNYYDKSIYLGSNILIKVHGQSTRLLPQKSLRVYADKKSDYSRISNVFFNNSQNEYDQLVLRNSGQDWNSLFLRDSYNSVIASRLHKQIYAEYKPIIIYINSELYGLLNLRERIEDEFLSEIFDVNDKSINFFENNGVTVRGDYSEYSEFIKKFKDISELNISEINQIIDSDNFIDYSLLNIFSVNSDWPSLNVKLFNTKENDRRFRYLINDLDITYGYGGHKQDFNKLNTILNDSVNDYSIVFNKFVRVEMLKEQLLTRAADLINSVFRPDNMKFVLDSLANQIREYIPLQQQRWEESCVDWENKIDNMKVFLNERPIYFMRNFNFYLNDNKGLSEFSLTTYPPNSGTFKVNTISVDTSEWSGRYFQTLPITITAVPKHGWKFVKWNHDSLGTNTIITTTLPETIELEAIYEETNPSEIERAIVINEIMYNADTEQDTKDWIELYNAGTKSVNLKNWSLLDEDDTHIRFVINEDYQIQPKEFVILTKELEEFEEVISIKNKIFGDFDFGLGGNDIVRLIDENGVTHDLVNYDNDTPWPIGADGTGYTIELINPTLDNNIGSNWKISKAKLGTAGKENSNYDSLLTSVILYSNSDYIRIEQFDRVININSDEIIKNFGLYSITGKAIDLEINRYNNTNTLNLNLSDLDRGVYLLLVYTSNKVETIKILLK